ncbi:hypothetical protein GBF38_000201 [Nibea albiflora]|nr:hypothetical protein GBF38_000201 [Nibea albiflora]
MEISSGGCLSATSEEAPSSTCESLTNHRHGLFGGRGRGMTGPGRGQQQQPQQQQQDKKLGKPQGMKNQH